MEEAKKICGKSMDAGMVWEQVVRHIDG